MNYHRIFIAINLPEKAKKTIGEVIEEWRNWPVRWTPKPNIHITLVFLGNVSNDEINRIGEAFTNAVSREKSFNLSFNRFIYGPKDFTQKEKPRMIWLEGPENGNLFKIQNKIAETIGINKRERKKFRPHITIGRIKEGVDLSDLPRSLDKKININFQVESVELMESDIHEGKRRYVILLSAKLGV